MARDRDSHTLTSRQRIGLLIVLAGSLAAFCIMLWKSREHALHADKDAEVVITELQSIAPIHVEDADTSVAAMVEQTDGSGTKATDKKSAKRKRSRKPAAATKPSAPPRDITAETVSP